MKNSNNQGFTLLEILLAVTILALVASMATFALSSVMKLTDITRSEKNTYKQAKVTFQRISEDLSSAIGGSSGIFFGNSGGLDGQDSLTFTSTVSVSFNPDDLTIGTSVIGYRVVSNREDPQALKLLRFDTPFKPGQTHSETPGFILCDNIKNISITYQDSLGQKLDSWSQPEILEGEQAEIMLPSAVFIKIDFWADRENESSLSFQTGVWLPTALYTGEDDA